MTVIPVAPVHALSLAQLIGPQPVQPVMGASANAIPFQQMLTDGIAKVNGDAMNADATVRAFALDDTVPLHQVTMALEQARMSLELAMQVRSRLLDGYQQLMNMQL
jgi:flagellar hook-basal body complex protein FliE